MNNLRRFIQVFACILLGMYVTLIFALDQPKVQTYLAQVATEQLEEILGSKVEIKRIEVGLFNAVELHDVMLYDKAGKVLLQSKLIYGKVRIASLIQGKVDLRNISILDSTIKLYKETADGELNLKFLIDAFKSDKKPKKPLDLSINSLLLRRCQLAYDEEYLPHPDDNRFSPHHIFLHDVNANVSLKELTDDNIRLRIRQLSFAEQSGFRVEDLRLRLEADRQHAVIKGLHLELPNSCIDQNELTLNYDLKKSKQFRNTLTLNGTFDNIRISTRDLAAFVPALKGLDETLRIHTDLSLDNSSLNLRTLSLRNETESLVFTGDVALSQGERLAIVSSVRDLQIRQALITKLFNESLHKPCPRQLEALGDLGFHGDVKFLHNRALKALSADDAILKGSLSTNLGVLDADVLLANDRLDLTLNSKGLKLSPLYEHKYMPSFVDFNATAVTSLRGIRTAVANHSYAGLDNTTADVQINSVTLDNHTYRNLHTKLDYNASKLGVLLTADDPAAKLQADISANLPSGNPFASLPSDLTFNATVDHLVPSQLQLTNKFGQGVFGGKASGTIHNFSKEDFTANVDVSDFRLYGDNGNAAPYSIQNFNLQLQPIANGSHLKLRSDFADLDYSGPVDPKKLKQMATNIYNNVREGVFNESLSANEISTNSEPKMYASADNDVNFIFSLRDAEIFNRLLGTRIKYNGVIQAQGTASSDGNRLKLSCLAPQLTFGKFALNDLSLYVRSEDGSFNVLGKGRKILKNGDLRVELTAINREGKIYTDVEWDEAYRHFVYGKLSAISTIETGSNSASSLLDVGAETNGSKDKSFGIVTEFTPSQLCIGDSLWQFSQSRLEYRNKRVKIDGFGIHNATQSLAINGVYDRAFEDAITVDLRNLDLDYVLAFARMNVVEFSGRATGKIYVKALPDGSPWARAEVKVPDLLFNHSLLGDADVVLGWDHAGKDITIDGHVVEKGVGYTDVKGYVDPINRDLDLQTESLNTQLGFLNKYTADIFSNVSGRATGNCRIYGGFQTIEFSGHEIGEAEATIPITGVTYVVKDADVDIVPDAFRINSATINDKFFGTGTASGILAHEHIKNMQYDFKLQGTNLRLYEKPRELDMPFFATATGSGNVHLHGKPGELNAEMHIKTSPGSELTYLLDSPDADVSQLLTFHDVTPVDSDTISTLQPIFAEENTFEKHYGPVNTPVVQAPTNTDINLYFEVDVDNNSCLHLITDDKSGDAITTYGSGPIQATYHNKSGFQMFGTYNIDRGTYNLNIPSLAQRRKFEILSGGRVTFSGDPSTAEVKVKAQYVVNSASLADLNIGTGFANNTTRVNCLANIYGEVANMQFDLGLELPNCSQDEQQMVNNLIATDEDRTMQVLYLLGVGRFYAYNYTANELGQTQSMLMMNSLLSSTLSSQLNNIISDAVGSSNWTFGTNISTGQLGWNDMEVEGLVSSRLLNNRLLLNGNFGYSDRQAATTNFVGDFDMQYLITPKGTVSIKAYSETNDRYFTKSSLTTQGVGLQLKKDFTRFVNLFRRKHNKNKSK